MGDPMSMKSKYAQPDQTLVTLKVIAAGIAAISAHWSDYAEGDGRDHTSEMLGEVYVAMRRLEAGPVVDGLKLGTASTS